MNRLMERGLLTGEARLTRPDQRRPLRMQAAGRRSTPPRIRLSRRLRSSILVGFSGGAAALICHVYLSTAPPAVELTVQALAITATVILTSWRASAPSSGRHVQCLITKDPDSAASN